MEKYALEKSQIDMLHKKGIYSSEHFARIKPKTYHDYRQTKQIGPEHIGQDIAVLGTLEKLNMKAHNKQRIVTATLKEYASKRYIYIHWIGYDYYEKLKDIPLGSSIMAGGTLRYNYEGDFYSMNMPFLFSTKIRENLCVIPEYGTTKHFSDAQIKELHKKCAEEENEDILWDEIKDQYCIMDQKQMKKAIYSGDDPMVLRKAMYRIIFEHLLYHAIKMEENESKYPMLSPFSIKTIKNTAELINNLPYTLTGDQQKICKQIKEHLQSGKRLNALVQGDVGSGKTMIAIVAMYMMADNGYQSVLMAPTYVLARQHYEEMQRYTEKSGFKVAFLGGKQKAAEKKEILKGIKDGTYDFIIGTHGVFSEKVEYHKLGMVITDEEHRFGVLQRESVVQKAQEGIHQITMSATPIPRTIASVLYGDSMQIYTVLEKPAGRLPIKTTIFNKVGGIFKFIENQLMEGHQAYIVCPVIDKAEEGSSMAKVMSVEETYEAYRSYFERITLPDGTTAKVGCITGKMKEDMVKETLEAFKENKLQVLVATTIVEVGVNVPNANVIVINSAERFGMAALHQLRGRVGRGSAQSYCILKSDCIEKDDRTAREATKRLNALCDTNDGYEIALHDLRNRGTGDITGTKQSGDNMYIDLMLEHRSLYNKLRIEAKSLRKTERAQEYIEAYQKVYDITEQME